MAIKVTGTTVINDNRGLENVTDINNVIKPPEVLSPTDNESDVDAGGLVIDGSAYSAIFGQTRDYREFQVDLATGDFSSPIVSQQVNSDSFTLSTDLADDTQHKVRIRDVDTDGNTSEFSDVVSFTTAADPFSTLGSATSGGFYMGAITAAGQCYYLIVAPNATGCACCIWKTSNTSTSGTCSLDDGYANTYPALENSTHPAGNWTATRTIDGFSDWYLPAVDELEVFYNNGAGVGIGDPLPSGEGFASNAYWSSTESGSTGACYFNFSGGARGFVTKDYTGRVRAVRRVPI